MSKLIIIHGPSGSGKSVVAQRLVELSSGKVALFEEDYLRRKVLHASKADSKTRREVSVEILRAVIPPVISKGYDVIVEGILSTYHYKPMFDELIGALPTQNFAFYFDVSFDETLRRHQTKENSEDFGEAEMKEWYPAASPFHYDFESTIPESSSLEDSVKLIRESTQL